MWLPKSSIARAALVVTLTAVALAVLGLAMAFAGRLMSKPHGSSVLKALEQEYEQVRPPPGARLLGALSRTNKTSQALVDGNYTTSARYPELRSYYDNELARHGWTPCGERPLKDWFTDLGGVSRTYCKGELRAHLQYAGERANYGWDFDFNMSWGLDPLFGGPG